MSSPHHKHTFPPLIPYWSHKKNRILPHKLDIEVGIERKLTKLTQSENHITSIFVIDI